MNRIEFMTQLAALLQDVPVEERQEAMKYYNDYFDDAGAENEHQVIEELESPAKVAATIKADLGGCAGNAGEFSERWYTDTRFDQKNPPADKNGYRYQDAGQEPPRMNHVFKIILIVAIILIGVPVIIPLGVGLAFALFGCVLAVFAFFIALVIAAVAVTIAGVSILFIGIFNLVPALAVGLALTGTGLIVSVIGVIATVASIRLCIVAFPGIIRGCVWLFKWPFQRRAVA